MKYKKDSDSRRYFDWIFQANMDFLAAKTLFSDERLHPVTSFHLQQCIEKSLKAYLLFRRNRLYDGHNITWLCKQAAVDDPEFGKWLPISSKLNRYYIETRYPADLPTDITSDMIDELFQTTTDMLEFIELQFRE
jgi:HEPN domain-containing protein